jgi:DNA repair ATPase RecN
MRLPQLRSSMLAVSVCLGLFMTACGENKLVQCNKVIQVANRLETIATGASKDATGFEKMSAQIESIGKEMQTLKVSDDKLGEFRDRFVEVYKEMAQSTRDIALAITAKDRSAIAKATNSIKVVLAKESPLNGEINRYCTGG